MIKVDNDKMIHQIAPVTYNRTRVPVNERFISQYIDLNTSMIHSYMGFNMIQDLNFGLLETLKENYAKIDSYTLDRFNDVLDENMRSSLFDIVVNNLYDNIMDLTTAVGLNFIQDIKEGMVDSPGVIHEEYNFPLDLIKKINTDRIHEVLYEIHEALLLTFTTVDDVNDMINDDIREKYDANLSDFLCVQVMNILQNVISVLQNEYFEPLIREMTAYYIRYPDMAEAFYNSFLLEQMDHLFAKWDTADLYVMIGNALRNILFDHLTGLHSAIFELGITTVNRVTPFGDTHFYQKGRDNYHAVNPSLQDIYKIFTTTDEEDENNEQEETRSEE